MTKTYGGSFGINTPLDDLLAAEPVDIEAYLADVALEDAQDAHEATLEAESDTHTVLRHTEFYPLHPDFRGWSIAEVDAALGVR